MKQPSALTTVTPNLSTDCKAPGTFLDVCLECWMAAEVCPECQQCVSCGHLEHCRLRVH